MDVPSVGYMDAKPFADTDPFDRESPSGQRKSTFIQSRLDRREKQKLRLYTELERAKEELAKSYDEMKALRLAQEIALKNLLEREERIEKMHKDIERALERYRQEESEAQSMRNAIDKRDSEMAKSQELIRTYKNDILDLEQELADSQTDAQAEASRQAEILDLKPAEVEAMALHSLRNRTFESQILKAADGSATTVMKRNIKSALFDKMTGMSEGEFSDLVQRILSARKTVVLSDEENVGGGGSASRQSDHGPRSRGIHSYGDIGTDTDTDIDDGVRPFLRSGRLKGCSPPSEPPSVNKKSKRRRLNHSPRTTMTAATTKVHNDKKPRLDPAQSLDTDFNDDYYGEQSRDTDSEWLDTSSAAEEESSPEPESEPEEE